MSEEYQRILKSVINHFDFIKDDLDATGRKGLLRLMFKRIVISKGKIADFELYEPFKSLYEGKGIKWEVKENQRVMANRECVSTYALSDDEWLDAYRTTLLFLKELFQYETSRSTKIAKPDGSNTTLPGN